MLDPEIIEKNLKTALKKEKEKVAKPVKSPIEIEEILAGELATGSSCENKKLKYMNYLKKMASDFQLYFEKNKSEAKAAGKGKKPTVFQLFASQKAREKNALFLNSSEILEGKTDADFLDELEIHEEIKVKKTAKQLDLSAISKDSEVINMEMSFLDENVNDVSKNGEIFILGKFQNPFMVNYKTKRGNLMINHTKIKGKLYSPLSKINVEIDENVEKKKNNLSFMSNGDELFF